jgi:hypothetical protein
MPAKRGKEKASGREAPEPMAKKLKTAKHSALMSPQDLVIECNGEKISTHTVILRQSKYFAAILDEPGRDKGDPIVLPDSFDPRNLREFVCVLCECLGAVESYQLEEFFDKGNIISLTELEHYFDVPLLHAACDTTLAREYRTWFPADQIFYLTKFSITHHLPLLKRKCASKIVEGNREEGHDALLAHLDKGRGDLAKDPAFMTELFTAFIQGGY